MASYSFWKAETFTRRCAPHEPLLFRLGDVGLIRLVTSWDTEMEDVDRLVTELAAAAHGH